MSKEQVSELLNELRSLRNHINELLDAVEVCRSNNEPIDTEKAHAELMKISNKMADILAQAVGSLE